MNGGQTKLDKVVVDTNVLFMSLYDSNSKAAEVIKFANNGKIKLYSPDSVQKEIVRVLGREMEFSEAEISFIIDSLPITWIEKGIYSEFLSKTKVKHKADKPVEAVSLMLNCGVLTADYDFKERVNINKLLEELKNVR